MVTRTLMALGLAGLLAATGRASAQQWAAPVAGDSTLRALVAEARERNPGLIGRQAAVQAAGQRVRPAGALPDPVLTAGVMDLVLPSFAFRQSDFTEVDVELMQEIPWPGTRGARADAARAGELMARGEASGFERDVTAATAAAYFRLRYVVTALETLRRQRALLEAAVQLSNARYASGLAPQSDPLQAKLARDRLSSEAYAMRAEYASALAMVNALRGRAPAESLSVTAVDLAALRGALQPLPPRDSLVMLAVRAHPRLAARRAAVTQAGRAAQVERLAARPDFSFSVRYGHRPRLASGFDPPDFFSAFLGLRLPIWAGRKQNRLADAARADYVGAGAALREAEVELGRSVVETAARAEAARARLELLVDGVLPSARGTVESVLRSYQVGRTEFLTLLAVEDARFRAELEAAAVAADYQTQLMTLRELTRGEAAP